MVLCIKEWTDKDSNPLIGQLKIQTLHVKFVLMTRNIFTPLKFKISQHSLLSNLLKRCLLSNGIFQILF